MIFGQRFFYGWVIVAVCFVALGLVFGIWYSFTVFFLAVMQDFGWSRSGTSLAFSVFALCHGFGAPIVGSLVQRFGARPVMIGGGLFLGLSLAACSTIQELWQYYLVFGVFTAFGISATAVVPCYGILGNWFVRRRGLAFGLASSGVGALGIMAAVPFNQYMISTIGWRSAYLIMGTIITIVVPSLYFLFLREHPQDMGLQPDGGPSPKTKVEMARQLSAQSPRPLTDATDDVHPLRTWLFWILVLAVVLTPISIQGFMVHAAPYLVDLKYDATFAAWVVSLVGLVSAPSKILFGFCFDRLGRERTVTLGVVCIVISLTLLTILPQIAGSWPVFLAVLFLGLGYGMQALFAATMTADLFFGPHYSVVYGCMVLTGAIGSAFGAWFAGYVFDVSGSYELAFIGGACAIAISCMIVWMIEIARGRQIKTATRGTES